ncbi:lipopolysaccharide assembly protein LapA domain-containing protein [Arthrobacter sp.]|uniref:lipopolysaccharide assembly protein LapA domain-containing protein n=1 Tax=Arthrobacter sp. TaxID=1667 RepID=UPI002811CED0|nr:lipopolysaccharide assembly protein LapA domain-containing protein [Arthrobacter sp.]
MTQQPNHQDPAKPREARAGYLAPESPGRSVPAAGTAGGTGANRIQASERPMPAAPAEKRVTRAGMVWVSVATALVVLVLLIVFILQNQDYVQVRFLGLEGAVSLGMALFIAAVAGGVLVAIAGAARIIQLRTAAHRRAQAARTPTVK